jgi:hypothetical protein
LSTIASFRHVATNLHPFPQLMLPVDVALVPKLPTVLARRLDSCMLHALASALHRAASAPHPTLKLLEGGAAVTESRVTALINRSLEQCGERGVLLENVTIDEALLRWCWQEIAEELQEEVDKCLQLHSQIVEQEQQKLRHARAASPRASNDSSSSLRCDSLWAVGYVQPCGSCNYDLGMDSRDAPPPQRQPLHDPAHCIPCAASDCSGAQRSVLLGDALAEVETLDVWNTDSSLTVMSDGGGGYAFMRGGMSVHTVHVLQAKLCMWLDGPTHQEFPLGAFVAAAVDKRDTFPRHVHFLCKQRSSLKVALEVHGPAHYFKNASHLEGSTELRTRLLRRLGWTVLSIRSPGNAEQVAEEWAEAAIVEALAQADMPLSLFRRDEALELVLEHGDGSSYPGEEGMSRL